MNERILLVGLGRWGQNHLKTLVELGVDVHVYDLNQDLIVKAHKDYPGRVTTGKDTGFHNYDGVIIATSPTTHADIVKRCMGNGMRNILCEKPLALDYKEAKEIFDEVRRLNVNLQIGHQLRYTTGAELLRKFTDCYFSSKMPSSVYLGTYVNHIINIPKDKKEVPIYYDVMGHVLDLFLSCGIGYPEWIELGDIDIHGNRCVLTMHWPFNLTQYVEIRYGEKARCETYKIVSKYPGDVTELSLDFRAHSTPPLKLEIQDWLGRFETSRKLLNAPDEKLYKVMDIIRGGFNELKDSKSGDSVIREVHL
jgi:predicted dehydrogenase